MKGHKELTGSGRHLESRQKSILSRLWSPLQSLDFGQIMYSTVQYSTVQYSGCAVNTASVAGVFLRIDRF